MGFLILFVACNTSGPVKSDSVVLNSDSLKLAESKMQEHIDQGKLAGFSTMVIKDGEVVQRANLGFADIENQNPIEDNTIFRIFWQCL